MKEFVLTFNAINIVGMLAFLIVFFNFVGVWGISPAGIIWITIGIFFILAGNIVSIVLNTQELRYDK